MARSPDAPSRMDVLILAALGRAAMHGYELKLELRYKHVSWWAKCEHGHLYAALARLERQGHIRRVPTPGATRGKRVFAITPSGRRRLAATLERLATAADSTYFDVDLFLNGAHTLDRAHVLDLLARRGRALTAQVAEARALVASMSPYVPAVGRLIMDHRVAHLERELAFTATAAEALRAEAAWGAYLGTQSISEFVERTGVPLEQGKRR